MHRPSSTSGVSSVARRAKASTRASAHDVDEQRRQHRQHAGLSTSHSAMTFGATEDEAHRTQAASTSTRQKSARDARDAPMDIHELQSSQRHATAPGTPSTSDLLDGAVEPCRCDEYRSLRCNDKLYSMLHNQIELDAAMLARNHAASHARLAERAQLKALFGNDLPPEEEPQEDKETQAAIMKYHASDFTLGNLKNQSTRVVLPPTIIYSAAAKSLVDLCQLAPLWNRANQRH
jgi:hypothetical protein